MNNEKVKINISEVHCPSCGSREHTMISIRDFDGNARFHSSNVYLNYICGCMRCGIVFIPKNILPKEEASEE